MRTKLVLQELAEASGGPHQSAERRTVDVMIVNVQPPTLVLADQVPVDQEAFHEVHPRVLLQISPRVVTLFWYDVPKLTRHDAERPEDVLPDIRREDLAARLFDDGSEQPVADIGVRVFRSRRERWFRILAQDRP